MTVFLGADTTAPLLSGCSAIDALGETPSATRLPGQQNVPTLDADESTDDAPVPSTAPAPAPAPERPAQIWVHSAWWHDGVYDIDVAAPHGASYTVQDTYSDDGNAPLPRECRVTHAKLTEKIKNAIASVDTLDTSPAPALVCTGRACPVSGPTTSPWSTAPAPPSSKAG